MITEFTPFISLFGGILIGIASVLLMLAAGRIMGATGILSGLLFPINMKDFSWRLMLILGMATAPLIYLFFAGEFPAIDVPVSNSMMVVGGLIVGIGVKFGGGCTSGHGVCGIARLSSRSIVATSVFMTFTALTVYLVRHVVGG